MMIQSISVELTDGCFGEVRHGHYVTLDGTVFLTDAEGNPLPGRCRALRKGERDGDVARWLLRR